MESMLLNGFRFYRQNGRPAAAALAKARQDVAAYHDAIAQGYGESKAARSHLRYPATKGAAVTWQPRDANCRRSERLAFVEDVDNAGLRFVGNVEAEPGSRNGFWSKRETCGWYTDPMGDTCRDGTGLCWGVVYQLPARDGKARFVAGYIFGGCSDDLPTIDFGHVFESDESTGSNYSDDVHSYDAARDAARAADSLAQHAAEAERDYQAAWQAGSRFSELGDDIVAARKSALALLAERRRAATAGKGEAYGAICAAIRDKVADFAETISEARAERKKLQSGDYVADWLPCFWSGDKRLQAAFNEGAGQTVFAA